MWAGNYDIYFTDEETEFSLTPKMYDLLHKKTQKQYTGSGLYLSSINILRLLIIRLIFMPSSKVVLEDPQIYYISKQGCLC